MNKKVYKKIIIICALISGSALTAKDAVKPEQQPTLIERVYASVKSGAVKAYQTAVDYIYGPSNDQKNNVKPWYTRLQDFTQKNANNAVDYGKKTLKKITNVTNPKVKALWKALWENKNKKAKTSGKKLGSDKQKKTQEQSRTERYKKIMNAALWSIVEKLKKAKNYTYNAFSNLTGPEQKPTLKDALQIQNVYQTIAAFVRDGKKQNGKEVVNPLKQKRKELNPKKQSKKINAIKKIITNNFVQQRLNTKKTNVIKNLDKSKINPLAKYRKKIKNKKQKPRIKKTTNIKALFAQLNSNK